MAILSRAEKILSDALKKGKDADDRYAYAAGWLSAELARAQGELEYVKQALLETGHPDFVGNIADAAYAHIHALASERRAAEGPPFDAATATGMYDRDF